MKAENKYQRNSLHDHSHHVMEYIDQLYGLLISVFKEGPYILKNLKGKSKKYGKSLPHLLYEAFIKYYLLGYKPSEYFEYQLYKNDYKEYIPMIELIKTSKINKKGRILLRSKYGFKKKLMENNISVPKLIAFYNYKEKKIYHYDKPDTDKVTIKPDTGGGGRGIKFLYYDDYENAVKQMKKNYLVEGYIKQHPFLNKIFDGSINSIRTLTIKKNNDFVILKAALRTGRKDSNGVDNFSKGGLSINIDVRTGVLKYGKTHFKHGEINHKSHPDTGFEFYNKKLPFYDEIINISLKAHGCFPMFEIVGWDIALAEDGPMIIEGNTTPGFFVYQIHEGIKPDLINTALYTKT